MLLRESLVSAQIAVSLVLLTSAGMLLRSLWKLESVPLGLDSEHVITAEFTLGRQNYSSVARQFQFFEDLEARMHAIPGVSAAAISDSLPPSGGMRGRPLATLHPERPAANFRGQRRYGRLAIRHAGLLRRTRHPDRARPRIHRARSRPRG